ncbi:MAG: protein kinase [Prolixibacteraceae bacterium]|nr:protein kinase [Prolixibacteraceae bacterium]
MATVYLAENNKFNTHVAIKVLNKEFVHNDNIRKRFLSEARNLFKMSHPNIVRVTDLIEEDETVAFVMEYIKGQTLKDYLADNGKLTEKEITNLFSQMLDAVSYIHEQDLVHRDIKPSNFMLSNKGVIKLMDFGIAKNLDPNSAEHTITTTTQTMGTPMYMSPEQIKSTKNVTSQSDIYSLGVVLWQMVTGEKPYNIATTSTFEIQTKIVNEALPLTGTKWDKLIQQCTQKETSARYKSIAEIKKNLAIIDSKESIKESKAETTIFEDSIHNEKPKTESTVIEEKVQNGKPPGWVSYPDYFPENENQSNNTNKNDLLTEGIKERSPKRRGIFLGISLVLIILIALIINTSNNKQNNNISGSYSNKEEVYLEDFNSFFSKFQLEPEFQISRIIFPLKKVSNSTKISTYIKKKDWTYSRLRFYWDESDNNLVKRYINISDDQTVISDKRVDNSDVIQYYFERIDGLWYFSSQSEFLY